MLPTERANRAGGQSEQTDMEARATHHCWLQFQPGLQTASVCACRGPSSCPSESGEDKGMLDTDGEQTASSIEIARAYELTSVGAVDGGHFVRLVTV
jgi:hypothetical protein